MKLPTRVFHALALFCYSWLICFLLSSFKSASIYWKMRVSWDDVIAKKVVSVVINTSSAHLHKTRPAVREHSVGHANIQLKMQLGVRIKKRFSDDLHQY